MSKIAPWAQRIWDRVWSAEMGDDEDAVPTADQLDRLMLNFRTQVDGLRLSRELRRDESAPLTHESVTRILNEYAEDENRNNYSRLLLGLNSCCQVGRDHENQWTVWFMQEGVKEADLPRFIVKYDPEFPAFYALEDLTDEEYFAYLDTEEVDTEDELREKLGLGSFT